MIKGKAFKKYIEVQKDLSYQEWCEFITIIGNHQYWFDMSEKEYNKLKEK